MSELQFYCNHCEELIEPGEAHPVNGTFHIECLVRAVVGSAAHQMRQCSCYGGEGGDPEDMPKRAAARLAYSVFLQKNEPRGSDCARS